MRKEDKTLCKTDASPYKICGSSFVKYIALDKFVQDRLDANYNQWIPTSELHGAYETWVTKGDLFNSEVVDSNISFSKKLIQILAVRGIASSLTRKSGERGISGIAWKSIAQPGL